MATRLSYTRRAYGVDRMRADSLGAGFTSAAERRHARRRLGRARRSRGPPSASGTCDVVGNGAGWPAAPTGLAAFARRARRATRRATARDVWGIGRFDAAAADERGEPVRASRGRRLRRRDASLDEPAVFDSAPRLHRHLRLAAAHRRRRDGQHALAARARVGAAELPPALRRSAADAADDRAPPRRARARRASSRPSSCRAARSLPVVAGDSLYWALELYVASDDYPLAERFHVLGERARLLPARGHGARACGERARAARARARARADHDELGGPLPVALRARPTALLARAAGRAAADHRRRAGAGARLRVGGLSRRQPRGAPLRHRSTAADSVASHEPIARRRCRALGVADVVAAARRAGSRARHRCVRRRRARARRAGSRSRRDGQRWGGTVDRLRAADTRVARRAGRARAGARRPARRTAAVLPGGVSRGAPARSPTLARVAARQRRQRCASGPRSRPRSVSPSATTAAGPSPQVDLRARAESLYRDMRDALRRGDWAAFGRAFDALGGALRVAPR